MKTSSSSFRHVPAALLSLLKRSLEDRQQPAYGQVATIDSRRAPQVRTVHLRLLSEYGALGFNTNTLSTKWGQLLRGPVLAGCYFDLKRQIQWRWSGSVKLLGAKAPPEDLALLDRQWLMLRAAVRKAYWVDYLGGRPRFDVDRRCPTFGTVVCLPDRWDVFKYDSRDYARGRRTAYVLHDGAWKADRISLLHGSPLHE